MTLPSSTTDDIEVGICGDQSISDEDNPIALMELYVQYCHKKIGNSNLSSI